MNQKIRDSLRNLAEHAGEVLKSVEKVWPEEEAKKDVMERSDRLHTLAAVRQLGIVATRSANRGDPTKPDEIQKVRVLPKGSAAEAP